MDSQFNVSDLLRKWGYEDLIGIFAENDIDEEALKSMDFNALKELIPKIGPRIKFWTKLKNFQEIYNMPVVINNSYSTETIIDLDDSTIEASSDTTTETLSNNTTSVTSSNSAEMVENVDLENKLIAVPYSLKATVGLPYDIAPAGTSSDSTVRHLIETTEDGQLIAASYKAGGEFLRQKLVSLIIRNEFVNNPSKSISSERFRKLAQDIYDMFPHEDPHIYYMPYVNENGEPRAASGKLYNHYIQARKQYKKIGLLDTKSKRKNICTDEDGTKMNWCDDQVMWLRNNAEPFPTVQEYWSNTFNGRQLILKSSEMTIHTYCKMFPALRLPLGYSLLIEDFDKLYPERSNNLFTSWSKFAQAVIKATQVKINGFFKHEVFVYLQRTNRESLNADSLNEVDQLFILTVLPLLFINSAPIKSKKKRWHPSRLETKEGFIIHVQSAADLEVCLDQRRRKYESFGLTAQPAPIWVGNLENIEASYVSVNDILYKVESPLKAIDVTFKIYFALQAEYPPEATLPWLLIQKGIYDILETDKSYISLTVVLSEIKKFFQ